MELICFSDCGFIFLFYKCTLRNEEYVFLNIFNNLLYNNCEYGCEQCNLVQFGV